jgi:hypothetical protein
MTASEQIENACREAHEKFLKLDAEVYKDIIEKLQFVIVPSRCYGIGLTQKTQRTKAKTSF